ncbi:MAG: type II toxin-antitoxin system RelE/ParE family toxin [Aliidongia sp.]
MIRSFDNSGLEELYHDNTTSRIDKRHFRNCLRILDLIDMATSPRDLIGVKDFHPLKGNRAGTYSMHVNGNWCITFRFEGVDVVDVSFEDYH